MLMLKNRDAQIVNKLWVKVKEGGGGEEDQF